MFVNKISNNIQITPIIINNNRMLSTIVRNNRTYASLATAAVSVLNIDENKIKEQTELIDPEWNTAKSFNDIPGPRKWEMIRGFMPRGKYYKLSLSELHQKLRGEFGTILRTPGMFGKKDIIMTYLPSDVEKVFRTEGAWPERRGLDTFTYYRQKIRPEIFKNMGGLLTEHGEAWGKVRSTVNPVMLPPRTVKMYIPVVDNVAQEFLTQITSQRDNNNELSDNFADQINRWALESIGVIALDKRLGALSADVKDEDSKRLIAGVKEFFILAYELDVLPSIWKLYNTPKLKRLMRAFDDMTLTVKKFVDDAIQKIETSKDSPKSDHELSVLEKLLKIDRHIAMVMTIDMLLAGVDTTSSATTGIMYNLAKNPDKQEKLREEIKRILPNIDSPLTPDSLNNIPYLRGCFKESMRLTPVVAGNFRGTGKNIVLQGYQIPKGTDVAMSSITHMDSINYPEPEKFQPERWLKEQRVDEHSECPSARNVHPFIYLPFGFGSRSCIGRRFAEMELEVFIARLIRQYKIEWNYEPIKYVHGLINSPTGKLKFKLSEL